MNGSNREAGRELDALVAEKVFGMVVKWRTVRRVSGDRREPIGVAPFSTDMEVAWSVVPQVQRRQPGWRFGLLGGDISYASGRDSKGAWVIHRDRTEAFGWNAEFMGHIDPEQNYGTRWGSARAATPALAICLAALAAIEANNTENALTPDASVSDAGVKP